MPAIATLAACHSPYPVRDKMGEDMRRERGKRV